MDTLVSLVNLGAQHAHEMSQRSPPAEQSPGEEASEMQKWEQVNRDALMKAVAVKESEKETRDVAHSTPYAVSRAQQYSTPSMHPTPPGEEFCTPAGTEWPCDANDSIPDATSPQQQMPLRSLHQDEHENPPRDLGAGRAFILHGRMPTSFKYRASLLYSVCGFYRPMCANS